MHSSYCLAQANKYSALKDSLCSLYENIDSCVSAISENEISMEELVISGKPVDDGKLIESKKKISDISNDIGTMINECEEKYRYWRNAYHSSLAEESKKDR